MSIQYQSNTHLGSTPYWPTDFAAMAAKPFANNNYVMGLNWAFIETGAQVDNPTFNQTTLNTQYPGWATVETVLNALLADFPNAHLGISILANTYGPTVTPAQMTSTNWGNGAAIPAYIANCGGTLTVPAAYGQTTGKITGSVPAIYPGSSYYGIAFGFSPGQTVWGGYYPMFWNNIVNQAFINMMQAGSKYIIQTGPYAGLTFDQCPRIEFFLMNDETSYAFLTGYNPSGGVQCNPPVNGTKATAIAGYKTMLAAVTATFPHTLIANDMTFSFDFANGPFTTHQDMAGWVNDNVSHTGTSLSTIRGLALSAADIYGTDWVGSSGVSGFGANAPLQGYAGASFSTNPNGTAHVLGPFDSTSLAGFMPKFSQAQPFDYHANLPSGVTSYTQGAVRALTASANNPFIQTTHRIWCNGDDSTFGTTAYSTYVQPALAAGTGIVPFSTTRPSNLP